MTVQLTQKISFYFFSYIIKPLIYCVSMCTRFDANYTVFLLKCTYSNTNKTLTFTSLLKVYIILSRNRTTHVNNEHAIYNYARVHPLYRPVIHKSFERVTHTHKSYDQISYGTCHAKCTHDFCVDDARTISHQRTSPHSHYCLMIGIINTAIGDGWHLPCWHKDKCFYVMNMRVIDTEAI